jgi:hypothetical protein
LRTSQQSLVVNVGRSTETTRLCCNRLLARLLARHPAAVYLVVAGAAVEYNGAQHYEYPNAFHATRQSFVEQRERDVLKHALCVANGARLIAIRARENLEDELGDFWALCATLGVSW